MQSAHAKYTEEDVENFQNNMLFNGKKFEMLRYGPNSDLKNSTNYLTPGYSDIIEVKDNLRDL